MAVKVDALFPTPRTERWRHDQASHMFADDLDELHEFAAHIGLARCWFHNGTIPHYDLTPEKRREAVAFGAIEVGRFEVVAAIRAHRAAKNSRRSQGWARVVAKSLDGT